MAVENRNNELQPNNVDWRGVCNKRNATKTKIVSEDQGMGKNSVQGHGRSKRVVLDMIGNFMLLKDTFFYLFDIANPSKSQDEYFEEILDGIERNYDAINLNYRTIQNVAARVDRNFRALRMVFELVNHTLVAVEKTRLDILQKIRNSEISNTISHLNLRIDYFNTEIKKIESLSEEEHIDKLLSNEDLLKDLRNARLTNKDSLHTYLHNIIFQGHAIPETANDKEAFSALNALYYGIQTYVSIMFFLLEQYTYIADYYYRIDEIDKFNEYFNNIVNSFDDFKHSLVVPVGSSKESLINNVINTLITAKNQDFIQYISEISLELSERIELLNSIKQKLEGMELPVMRNAPEKILGSPEFVQPEIRTPIGEWKDGAKVSYAIQYRNKAIYSKVGKWSDPATVSDAANLILRIPTDRRSGKSRVIFRKFNNANVQLVGVLEDDVETYFKDIDRDLYNAALNFEKNKAIKEVNIYVQNGANVNAEFDNGRRAIHAAAQRDNTQLAKDLCIYNNSTDLLNVKDSDGFTPMHVAAAAGHDKFIEFLINSSANINERTYSDEFTPLHIAAYKGFKSTVEVLIRSDEADVNAQDKKGFTPLHSAVLAGFHVVQALISNGNVDINAKSKISLTALHLSSIENFPDIVETLVKSNKIDVNARALGNITALHFASIFGHTETINLLAAKNETDINAQSYNNLTALHYAVCLQRVNVVSELLKINGTNVNKAAKGNITALHIAAIIGQNNVVRYLLENKAEIEAKTSDGLTALHLAATQGNHETVSTLIDKGANIEEKTFSGLTPFLSAVSSKNTTVEVVKILLERGANVKAVADDGESYPYIAYKKGNSDIVNFIINSDEDYYVHDRNGNYFLHYAAQGGNLDVVKYLIQKEGNFVNVKNFNKETPLHFAAKSGNLDLVQYLIEKERASIDAVNEDNETPLHFAAENGHSDIAIYLIEEKNAHVNEKLVLLAATGGSLRLVTYLVEKLSLNVNVRNKNNETVLHLAARSGNLQLVRYLIEKQETNVFAKTDYDQFPLNFGIQSGNLELVKYLAEKTLGSFIEYREIDVKDKYGKTPLHYAIGSNNLDLVKYLVNLSATDQSDKIPLHFAVESSNVAIVKYLLGIGAKINSVGYENRTPLHIALMRNDLDIVHCLLEKGGIDVTAKDKFNITSLHLAAQSSSDVVKYLVEKGADINAKRHGELCSTPLCFAIKVGNFEIVKYLIKEGANINDAVNPEFVSVNLADQNINNLDTLHFAVSVNNSDVVKYLVQKGAEPNKAPWNGFLLLVLATMRCNFDLVQYFGQKGSDFRGHSDNYSLLHVAAKAGNLDIVKYLIDKGLNVGIKDFHGRTTLHFAADSGNVDLVQYLIEMENMDPNNKDKFGNTPLQSAVENGKLETAKYLMEKTGIDINITNDVKYSLLHSAVVSGNLNLVKYLTDKGADVNAESQSQDTPLHLAAKDLHFDIVKFLVKKNADAAVLNNDHKTSFDLALSHRMPLSNSTTLSYNGLMQYFIVRYLIEEDPEIEYYFDDLEKLAAEYDLKEIKNLLRGYLISIKVRKAMEIICSSVSDKDFNGADLTYKDTKGWTLLHLTAYCGMKSLAQFLVSKGLNIYAQDKKHKTPPDIAADEKEKEVEIYFENVKRSTGNHYHKRDTLQKLNYKASVLNHNNISEGLSTSSKNNMIGYSESNVASGASKSFSLIHVFVTILLNSVKSITLFNYFFKPTISVEYSKACTAVTVEHIETNSTLFLLDVFIKKVTGQKYIYIADTSMSLAEANGYALDIVTLFERAVRQAVLYSRISLHRLNIDFLEVQKDCMRKVLGNKFNEIPEILKLHIERACPERAAGCSGKLSMKKFDKFTDEFNKILHIKMSRWIQNAFQTKIMAEEVMEAKWQSLGLEYKKNLSNTRVQYV